MITNFEHITYDLTEEEKKLVPVLIKGFNKHVGKPNAIKAPDIIVGLAKHGILMSETRLRKLVNYIRCTSTLPVIGTSCGYYVSEETQEISKEVKSLRERAASILGAAEGLERFIK